MPDQEEGYAPYQEETPVEEPVETPEAPETPVPEHEEAEEPEPEEPEHAEQPKKKTGSQRAREALQREREARLRAEAERDALKGTQASKPVERPSGKPAPDAFETHEEFIDALTDWKVSQALTTRAQQTEQEKQRERWEEQKEAVREKYQDFDEVFENAPMPSPLVANALLKHKVGAEIAYYLGTHPAEYKRIDRLNDPMEVGFEMAEIAAKLAATPGAKPTSKAPAPITPTRGSAAAAKSEGGYDPY